MTTHRTELDTSRQSQGIVFLVEDATISHFVSSLFFLRLFLLFSVRSSFEFLRPFFFSFHFKPELVLCGDDDNISDLLAHLFRFIVPDIL
jgi:hypothetical protein